MSIYFVSIFLNKRIIIHFIKERVNMHIYSFGVELDIKSFESIDINCDRLYASGCDDCIITEQKGHVILDFARKAHSKEEAIDSAIADVEKAGYKVKRYVE